MRSTHFAWSRIKSNIFKNEDNFPLQLQDHQDQLQLFVRANFQYNNSSLMPAHYDKTPTPRELQNLLTSPSRPARAEIWSQPRSGEDQQ